MEAGNNNRRRRSVPSSAPSCHTADETCERPQPPSTGSTPLSSHHHTSALTRVVRLVTLNMVLADHSTCPSAPHTAMLNRCSRRPHPHVQQPCRSRHSRSQQCCDTVTLIAATTASAQQSTHRAALPTRPATTTPSRQQTPYHRDTSHRPHLPCSPMRCRLPAYRSWRLLAAAPRLCRARRLPP